MARNEYFQTRAGEFRILVEQVIDGKTVDWHLVELRSGLPRGSQAVHKEAVEQFVGREVEYLLPASHGYDYVFAVKKTEGAAT